MILTEVKVALNVFVWYVETWLLAFIMASLLVKHAKPSLKEPYKETVEVSLRGN